MSVRVRCNCGYRMELPDEWAGKQGRCPQCHSVLDIPAVPPSAKNAGAKPVSGQPADVQTRRLPVASQPPRPPGESSAALPKDRVGSHQARAAAGPSASRGPFTPAGLAGSLRRPMWLAAVVAGVGLVGVGLYLLRPADPAGTNGPENRVPGDSDRATHDDVASDVFRPQLPRDDSAESPPQTSPTKSGPKEPVATAAVDRQPGAPQIASSRGPATLDAWSLRDFGVEIPSGVNLIEIDGVLLPLKDPPGLTERGPVPLVLPMGTHIVRFARTGTPQVVEPRRWFLDVYREAAGQLQQDGRWSFERLLEVSRRTLDRFTDPLVPHFWGNYYWQQGELDAAVRHYTWALEIAPTFAPSYLNLAQLAHERGEDEAARRYLRLADLWNTQNAYGLSIASSALRGSLGADSPPAADDGPDWFVPQHGELSARDRDMVAVLRSAAEFTPQPVQRAKILNNIGAYFEHMGKPELALEHYRTAAASMQRSRSGPEERRVVVAILNNLTRVCRAADMPEYRRYERLQASVGE